MAELFLEPIIEKFIDGCSEYLKNQLRWQTGMKKELASLKEIHTKIKGVVFATEISDQNSDLNKWIWQLRDAIDEANDVLDEFKYTKLKEQQTRKPRSLRKSAKEKIGKLGKIGERLLNIDRSLKKLEEVLQKLNNFSIDIHKSLSLLETTETVQQRELYKRRETGSMPNDDMIDRDKYKEFVMQWLLSKPSNEEHQTHITAITSDKDISLLSIVGLAGVGKTFLLQHVLKDEKTEEFYPKMWISVSQIFHEKQVIAKILQSLNTMKTDSDSLDSLQKSLRSEIQKSQKSEVKSNKFLLVLDDIWQEDRIKWECVFTPLAEGSLGGKILVTTRTDSIALMIARALKKKGEILRLEDLEKHDCLQLVDSLAFLGAELNGNDVRNLRSIAGEIVEKLSGSPLEARAIGDVLNHHVDESSWKKILNGDIESMKERQKERMKKCQKEILSILRFSYIFLQKEIQNCFAFCGIFPQDHMFDKEDLVRMWIALGFIQQSSVMKETVEVEGRRYFHVLAKNFLFGKFQTKYRKCYKMHALLYKLANSVSVHECFRFVGDEELQFRTPETTRHLSVETSNLEVLKKICELKNLHSLFLFFKEDNQYFVDVLKQIFEASTSIRLLYIYAPYLTQIPEKIDCLIHLRYLKLDQTSVTQMPRSLSNLYHLQFIIYNEKTQFSPDNFPGICEIGKLNSLQGLNGFYVKNESGFEIKELEHMNELRQLRIKLLEKLNDADEACNAKLCDKINLTDLSLEWSSRHSANSDLDEKVLEKLRPHNNLKKLRINAYMGARSAEWMGNIHLISKLEYIKLDECLEWQTFPPFWELPLLKYLYLQNMPKVRRLNIKFPKLKVLHIEKLEALEIWFDAAAAVDSLFCCLTELYLKDCPKLQELPSFPPKLKKLEINNIGWNALNCCSISNSIPLETLMVVGCPNIKSLPQCLPSCFSSLKHLYLKSIPLVELPDLFHSLVSLSIHECPPELMERYRRSVGSDWLKIAHIRHIEGL